MDDKPKVYLGDSVYAQITRGMISLTTENGYDEPSNKIFLEPEVYAALKFYVESEASRN